MINAPVPVITFVNNNNEHFAIRTWSDWMGREMAKGILTEWVVTGVVSRREGRTLLVGIETMTRHPIEAGALVFNLRPGCCCGKESGTDPE